MTFEPQYVPHVHSALIHELADGKEMQWRLSKRHEWQDVVGSPVWNPSVEYRVKPPKPATITINGVEVKAPDVVGFVTEHKDTSKSNRFQFYLGYASSESALAMKAALEGKK